MKKGLGFFGSIITAAVACIGLAFYFINSNTTYFTGLGKDGVVIGSAILGVAALFAAINAFFDVSKQ